MSFIKWKLFEGKCKAADFAVYDLRETAEPTGNPARGWYRIVYFAVHESPKEKLTEYGNSQVDNLELVILDISAYREEDISNDGIGNIREILEWYRKNKQEIILRIVYDHEGKAPEKEPFFFEYVAKHMTQIGEVLQDYPEVVFVYQGLLVGNWGEMHTSRFMDPKKLERLSAIFEEKTQGKIYHAVRKPVQWRQLQKESLDTAAYVKRKLGLFDDGILGSESHLGTFGNEERKNSDWCKPWTAADELEFEAQVCKYAPNGGETVFPQNRGEVSLKDAVETLSKMGITYLNKYYDPKLLRCLEEQAWRSEDTWNGKNGLDYIGAHLGYRYVVRDINVYCKQKKTGEYLVRILVQNKGFAGCYQPICLKLGWTDLYGSEQEAVLVENMMDWNGQSDVELECSLTRPVGKLRAWMERVTDGRVICFANPADDKGKVVLGSFLD